jgi:MtaA/CmuA family methyltransferase
MFRGEPVDRLPLMPITMMFAGDLAGIPYGRYTADHRRLVEAQLATAEQFDFDYVSAISDPAREAADCGATVQFFDNQPPAVDEVNALLADKTRLAGLTMPDPLGGGRMTDRVDGVRLLSERVAGERMVEGWIEGPVAEASDLRGINRLMTDFFDDPDFVRDLFEFNLEMGIRFARAQREAGAELMGVGDAAASLVGPQIYEEFVLPYEKRLVDALHEMGLFVRLHICGNISRILPPAGTLGCAMADIDSMVPIKDAREQMGPDVVLAGNLDPVRALRDGVPESIHATLAECHAAAGPRYIVAAGCEIPRDTPHENVQALAEFARSASGRHDAT